MNSICVVTGSRAEYYLLTPLLDRLASDLEFDLRLVVTGSHLSDKYGMTIDAIEADGRTVDERISILSDESALLGVNREIARGLLGFDDYFQKRRPDLVVLLGDRYELMSVAIAATNRRIPIAHIHGGESTEGAVDEAFRHSITKMSYLHFACCEVYRRRVIQLGENPNRVFNVGSLGIENMLAQVLLTREEFENEIGADLGDSFFLVTYHPETLSELEPQSQIQELLAALDDYRCFPVLFTKANADEGGCVINDAIESYASRRKDCIVVSNLGSRRYASALSSAAVVLGNSSSGILESPTFGVPTVNIGDRQAGRVRAGNIIDCPLRHDAITNAIAIALSSEFVHCASKYPSPYGCGDASRKIVDHLKTFFLNKEWSLKKAFYDISLPENL